VDIVAASAPDHHHAFVVGVFGEGTDGLGLADRAAEFEDVEFSAVRLYSWHFRQDRNASVGFEVVQLLTLEGC
jgi:hypothetical protein